jgi:hypothetical protein
VWYIYWGDLRQKGHDPSFLFPSVYVSPLSAMFLLSLYKVVLPFLGCIWYVFVLLSFYFVLCFLLIFFCYFSYVLVYVFVFTLFLCLCFLFYSYVYVFRFMSLF